MADKKKKSYEEKYAKFFDSPFGVDEYDNGKKRFSRGPAKVIVGTVSGICKVLYRYEVENRENLWQLADKSGVVVISNHKFAAQFRAWAAKRPLPITVVDDGTDTNETRLGAVRDILFAVEARDVREDALVLAGDNVLDFSLVPFIRYGREHDCPCVMCYEENEPAKQRRTAIITVDAADTITGYAEKPEQPQSNLAVPPFYFYRAQDIRRIPEALAEGCGTDAPGSFAAWLSMRTPMKAYRMPGSRYDIGNLESYERIKARYRGIVR